LCLTGRFDEALERALTAEKAFGWGRWYQWQANAVRTRGWVWLHIGGRLAQIRKFADQQAYSAFREALELANKFVTEEGEMVEDRIKALLELMRLDTLYDRRFEWDQQLADDLATVAKRKTGAHERYQLIADHPPRSRESLG
jgi:hypothetical protein